MLLSEQPAASLAYQARVYCGSRLAPTLVKFPSRQDDGNIRAPALAFALARGMVAVVYGCGCLLCTAVCPPARSEKFCRQDMLDMDYTNFVAPVSKLTDLWTVKVQISFNEFCQEALWEQLRTCTSFTNIDIVALM